MDHPIQSLVDIMRRLRGPNGCPWDLEQDHRTLKPYIIEEAFELLDAIDDALASGDDRPLIEELGDLLLQVVFHSQIGSESGRFDLIDVIDAIREKLIRRHPHVFGEVHVRDATEVIKNWEEIKREEKGERSSELPSVLDGLPKGLPALTFAYKVQERAARVGFDWESADGAIEKLTEEVGEVLEATRREPRDSARIEEEWGDLFFSLVNIARHSGIDPESALRASTRRFAARFQYIERAAALAQRPLESMSLEEMDALWDEAKKSEEAKTSTAPHPRHS